jgi:hypothetical protein
VYKQHYSHIWKSCKGILCTNTNVLQSFPDFFNQLSTNFWGSFWHQISTASYNEKRLCTSCRLCNVQITINFPKLDVWWGKRMGKLPLCPCTMSWKDVKIIGYALCSLDPTSIWMWVDIFTLCINTVLMCTRLKVEWSLEPVWMQQKESHCVCQELNLDIQPVAVIILSNSS